MTGAEHYREAEVWLHNAGDHFPDGSAFEACMRRAAVHAQLATAAAIVDAGYGRLPVPADDRWREVMRPADSGGSSSN